jgi:hypothetical protein
MPWRFRGDRGLASGCSLVHRRCGGWPSSFAEDGCSLGTDFNRVAVE